MKRFFFVAIALVAVCGFAFADLASQDYANVRVLVSPNVNVLTMTSTVEAPPVQTGIVTAVVTFQVDANKQEVSFYVQASDLWKGDDPTNTEVLPIVLEKGSALVKPANGNATGGHSNELAFNAGPGEVVAGFPTTKTETVVFSSSQNNHFSQLVNVTCRWNQTDAEKPTGEYSGVVKLTALVLPSPI